MSLPVFGKPYGPYFVEWHRKKGEPQDFWNATKADCSLYYSWATLALRKNEAEPRSLMLARLDTYLRRAADAGKWIWLAIDFGKFQTQAQALDILKRAAPFWSQVIAIEVYDEPSSWSRITTAVNLKRVRAMVKSLGLEDRPLEIVYAYDSPTSRWYLDAADIAGIEAYVDPPGGTRAENLAAMTDSLDRQFAAVPNGKRIRLIPMAYTRNTTNGVPNFVPVANIPPLIRAAYKRACHDQRVMAVTPFSWARPSGCCDFKELADAVLACGRAAQGKV